MSGSRSGKHRSTRLGLRIAAVWLALAVPALADAVYTSDGSKIVGKIERLAGGKLVIQSSVAGRIEIDATKVVAIALDEPMTVEFDTGDRLVGTIDVSNDHSASVMKTALGEMAIAPDKIKAIWPVGRDSPTIVAMKSDLERKRKAVEPNWSAKVEAGGSRTEGNTDTRQARGRLDLWRKTSDDTLHFFLAAQFSEQDDTRTKNEYRGGVDFEGRLNERWHWYNRIEMEFDEFEDLDLRTTAAAGAGYYWVKKPEHEAKTRVGLGYRHETFAGGRTEDAAVLDIGLDYRRQIAPWAQFTHSSVYSPSFEQFGDYRLDLDTALVIPLEADAWNLKLGLRNEYSSTPQPGFDRLDNTYYANVVYSIK